MAKKLHSSVNNNSDKDKERPKLPESFEKIIQFIPNEEQREEATEILRSEFYSFRSYQYSAPIPPGIEVEKWESVVSGAGNRILSMAEREQSHRIDRENYLLPINYKLSARAQIFSLTIGILGIGSTVVLGLFNHPVVASIIGSVSLAVIIGAFIFNKTY